MDFQIRDLMIKLSPADKGDCDCKPNSGIGPSDCCPHSCGASMPKKPLGYGDPKCEAPTNSGNSEGDNDENPAEAAYNEGPKGLVLLQQQLRQTLSQQAP